MIQLLYSVLSVLYTLFKIDVLPLGILVIGLSVIDVYTDWPVFTISLSKQNQYIKQIPECSFIQAIVKTISPQ